MQWLLQIRFELAAGVKPEAERMTAAKADVFGPFASNLVDCEEVAQHYAGKWVPDNRESSLC
jgi:hypothetical protein